MSNLTKLKFDALDISSKNYQSWILDAKIQLDAMTLVVGLFISGTRLLLPYCSPMILG